MSETRAVAAEGRDSLDLQVPCCARAPCRSVAADSRSWKIATHAASLSVIRATNCRCNAQPYEAAAAAFYA